MLVHAVALVSGLFPLLLLLLLLLLRPASALQFGVQDLTGATLDPLLTFDTQISRTQGGQYTGTFPTEIGRLTLLTRLRFAKNGGSSIGISGTLPTELGTLTLLREINLQNAPYLTGTIPSELGNLLLLTKLQLTADVPLISGTLPSSLGRLGATGSTLDLRVGLPRLSGLAMPLWVPQLFEGRLEEYMNTSPEQSGTIPSTIGRLTALQRLTLGGKLSGTFPREIGDLPIEFLLVDFENTGSPGRALAAGPIFTPAQGFQSCVLPNTFDSAASVLCANTCSETGNRCRDGGDSTGGTARCDFGTQVRT